MSTMPRCTALTGIHRSGSQAERECPLHGPRVGVRPSLSPARPAARPTRIRAVTNPRGLRLEEFDWGDLRDGACDLAEAMLLCGAALPPGAGDLEISSSNDTPRSAVAVQLADMVTRGECTLDEIASELDVYLHAESAEREMYDDDEGWRPRASIPDAWGFYQDIALREHSEEARRIFTGGQCLALASELADFFGTGRMVVVYDAPEDDDEDDGRLTSLHIYGVDRTGRLWDYNGPHDRNQVATQAARRKLTVTECNGRQLDNIVGEDDVVEQDFDAARSFVRLVTSGATRQTDGPLP